MLPPLLFSLRQSLMQMPEPRSDAQDALLEELDAVSGGGDTSWSGSGSARSLGIVANVCPMCQRSFSAN